MAGAAIEDHARRVLERVTTAGATGDPSLKARDGDLEEHKVNSARSYGVRVIAGKRAGIAYSEAADAAALDAIVAQAQRNAAFARRTASRP